MVLLRGREEVIYRDRDIFQWACWALYCTVWRRFFHELKKMELIGWFN